MYIVTLRMKARGLAIIASLFLPISAALTTRSTSDQGAVTFGHRGRHPPDFNLDGAFEELGLDLAGFLPFADDREDPEVLGQELLFVSRRDNDSKPDCWMPCGRQSGRCHFCGDGGACCRKSWSRNPSECHGVTYTQAFRHECVSIVEQVDTAPDVYRVDKAVYKSVINDNIAKDVTDQVNELLRMNGPRNVTGRMDLNPLFGDIAPREPKILRVSVGPRWRDMKEVGAGGPANKTYDITSIFPQNQDHIDPPSIFIAVFSRRAAATRRALVRHMWQQVAESGPEVVVRFALCDVSDTLDTDLQKESEEFEDLLMLPCAEGYGHGALTQKVLASMTHFRNMYPNFNYFMKVDDDTFIAWERFYRFLAQRASSSSYIGVPIDGGIPCRNASFRWYEPYSTFNDTYFPKGMAGGPGYTFGKELVEEILDTGIGHANVLWNEDRAAGVWVDKLTKQGRSVKFVEVPGIDGWWSWDWRHPMKNWATWADYPYILHHGLHGESIACLALADKVGDPWRQVNNCFAVEVGEQHEAFVCARQTEAEIAKR